MYLLDTNHCSLAIMRNVSILNKLAELQSANIFISAIVRGELIYMAERSQRKQLNFALIHNFLDQVVFCPIDVNTADMYGQIKSKVFDRFAPKDKSQRRRFTLQNLGFSENDLWIAATALLREMILVSADRDFTRIQQVCPLTVESWVQSVS
jgi:tRNA(fMet)-specific endonuclease VapC